MLKGIFKRYVVLLAALSSLAAPFIATVPVHAEGRNCSGNSVIRCGAYSVGELKADYRANQGGNVDDVFRTFHINNESYFDGMVEGRVTNKNEVWVGNKKVADRAVTAGRTNIKRRDGTWSIPIAGGAFYMRNPSDSFGSAASLRAFVKMDGETFKYAVIMSCGNPVNAYPTTPPKPKPQPQPKPTPPPEKPKPAPEVPKQPKLELSKDVQVVSSEGIGPFWNTDETEADPGDKVYFRITLKSVGDAPVENIVLRDTLPQGVTYQPDMVLNGLTGVSSVTGGNTLGDLIGDGITLGSLAPGQSVEIMFPITIDETTDACETPLRNIATAEADKMPELRDDAEVKVCQPEEQVPPEQPEEDQPAPQVQGAQTPPSGKLPETGAAVFGAFSATSFIGFAAYKLKEFYTILLR